MKVGGVPQLPSTTPTNHNTLTSSDTTQIKTFWSPLYYWARLGYFLLKITK